MDSFADIIGAWPSAVTLAADVGVKPVTARAWKARGIPSEYWRDVVQAAGKRNIGGVTLETLARLAAARREDRNSGAAPASEAA